LNGNIYLQTRDDARFRTSLVAALALAGLFGMVNQAAAQPLSPPTTPALITPPTGAKPFLLGRAGGTQGYVCLPTTQGASWTVNNARPEATLFTSFFGQDFQIITHFLSPDTNPNKFAPNPLPFGSPTWQSSFDSSKVWAKVLDSIPADSDPSCPNSAAIACLLLQSIGSQQGPTGGKVMTQVSYIQRLNTQGGLAPTEGCSVSTDVGKQVLVPYRADYWFFRGGVN
jgi:Protein of unknown function (DUF3455)